MSVPTINSIQNILFDEQECIKFLIEKEIIYKIENCEICNSEIYQDKKVYRCRNKECKKAVSIYTNSFFAQNHITCTDILLLGYYWICKARYTTISMITRHSARTITKYTNIFRDLVISTLTEDDLIVGGRNIIVEIDESKFKKLESWWVVGGVERTLNRKCFFELVEDRDKETLKQIIKKYVRRGSIIHTDSWKAYSCVEELGFRHRKVNHSRNRIERGSGVHTNNIEGLWHGVKLNISSRNRNKDIIEKHLLEFIWRRKNQNNIWNSFLDALKSYRQ
jgi:transposase-like protein